MKRDLDLIRNLLIYIENHVDFDSEDWHFSYDYPDRKALGYALKLMRQKGLIEAKVLEDSMTQFEDGHYDVVITWDGADFLDTVRDDEIWRKTKEGAKEAGGFTFDLVKALAKGFVKKNIEKHTGVELDL